MENTESFTNFSSLSENHLRSLISTSYALSLAFARLNHKHEQEILAQVSSKVRSLDSNGLKKWIKNFDILISTDDDHIKLILLSS